jgi:hypothetical protein
MLVTTLYHYLSYSYGIASALVFGMCLAHKDAPFTKGQVSFVLSVAVFAPFSIPALLLFLLSLSMFRYGRQIVRGKKN